MLDNLFSIIAGMSLTAACAIVAVLAINALLRVLKAPAFIRCALWLAVLFRLICPVAPVADISLFGWDIWQRPIAEFSTQAIPEITVGDINIAQIPAATTLPQAQQQPQTPAAPPASPLALLWLGGLALLLGYHSLSYLRFRKSISGATVVAGNIYRCENLGASFVCGLLHPRIYLPAHLDEKAQLYILPHEQAHIRRLDHLLKPLWLFACCVHWFNPLVWLAFSRMCAEMEQSCDEAVLRKLGNGAKADYCRCLLSLAGGQTAWGLLPGFGQKQMKGRVQHILGYKKPAIGMVLLSALVVIATACALTTNATPPETPRLQPQPQLQAQSGENSPRTKAELEQFVAERLAAYQEMAANSTFNQRGTLSNEGRIAALPENMENAEAYIKEILEQRLELVPNFFSPSLFNWPYIGGITETFGTRNMGFHSGIDIMGPTGDSVTASLAGEVALVGWYYGYGNCVIIDHGGGWETYYGHLSAFAEISVDDTVAQDQVIGYIGASGRATGPCLHFEIRQDGNPLDPLEYLGNTLALEAD